MPSIAAHMICCKLVSDRLDINSEKFIRGNLLPDIIDKNDSHCKIKGKYYYIPNIECFLEKSDLSNELCLGYLTHLLLDKYFLEDYIYDVVNGEEVFLSRIMYKEYDIINYELLKRFDIDVEYLNFVLKEFEVPIDKNKYDKNMKCLNNEESIENLKFLNVDDFSKFLIEVSSQIADYLEEVKKYETKACLSYNSFRQRNKS